MIITGKKALEELKSMAESKLGDIQGKILFHRNITGVTSNYLLSQESNTKDFISQINSELETYENVKDWQGNAGERPCPMPEANG